MYITPNRKRLNKSKHWPDGRTAKPRPDATEREKFARAMTRAVFGKHYWDHAKQAELEKAISTKGRSA